MTKSFKNIFKNIAVVLTTAMFFSCGNDIQEVRDFLADKNLPIGVAENVYNIHTDSGKVDLKLAAPLLYDYSNRQRHPYSEFPKGLKIVTLDENNDSLVVTGNYAIIYSNTNISEIRDNVVITNYVEHKKLLTEQLFWDQKTKYFYTEKPFTLITLTDTIYGVGLDASEDLKTYMIKENRGSIYINESN
ncbi:LPS export ABC transporter periplasmic protein LptC [Urechidicola croceus]|uniref:LPS export ABC transporter periplasmic protein LptC n=1 Tax=Urechidicola croceus TaxID=1850246 RepID=A0A1D8P765_9FLAO|nr:LPS export ABC transporter periplasmic protein LptC [Urechidicola croceus]AOW20415.1 LPS export ABC transporter periplasmic protein LptC [Urechidicola croceus]